MEIKSGDSLIYFGDIASGEADLSSKYGKVMAKAFCDSICSTNT